MTFEEFLKENNLTPENTPGSEHALLREAYKAGEKSMINAYNKQANRCNAMMAENEQLKKNAIVWHKTDFEEPEDLPLEDNQKCLILFRNGNIWSATFWRGDCRCSFETYSWKEIEAWAERPEVKL